MKLKSGSKTMVMLALLAVLLVSLGYLSMQGGGREGLAGLMEKEKKEGFNTIPPPLKKK